MLRIGTKLGLGIGALLALCVIIGLVSYTQTATVQQKLEEVTLVRGPANSAVYALENRLVEIAFAAFSYSAMDEGGIRLAGLGASVSASEGRSIDSSAGVLNAAPGVSTPVRDGLARLEIAAREHVLLRTTQGRTLDTLNRRLEGLDRLLIDRIQNSVRVDDPIAYRRLQVVLGMQVQISAITKHLGSFLLTGDEQHVASIRKADAQFREFISAYQVLLLRPEEKTWASELRSRSDLALRFAETVLSLEYERRKQRAAFLDQYRALRLVLNEGVQTQTERSLAKAKADLLDAGRTANTTILGALLLSLLVGVGVGYVTTRNITRPLDQLTGVMRAIAGGNISQRVAIRTHDEFRLVGDTFNQMADQIEEGERMRTESLRLFTIATQQAQEEERARIARELHDDLCQRLTGTKYRVEVLHDQVLSTHRRMAKDLDDVMQELDRSITEVRRMSFNLRPSVLDDFGLVPALRLLCSEFQKAHGITTSLEIAGDIGDDIGAHTEIALYRIAQEALTNVAKHAGATRVSVSLTREESFVRLHVEDDGKGFAYEEAVSKRGAGHGLGLISMRERAELLGGSCAVTSTGGKGTLVAITVPRGGDDANAKDQNPHRG
ncbi:MAG TPA: ATP-binding protein [Bacteroidota bacterium]|nr:ATP-binding protein [Bacteroidota bacterium]